MGSFVNPNDKVEIPEEEPWAGDTPRVITIRAKMDYGTQTQVQGTAWKVGEKGKGTDLNVGDSLMALLTQNILAWRGGDLEGVPCDSAHIRMLDPTDPFIDRVANEIGERNKARPSPNLTLKHDVTGSMNDGAHDFNTSPTPESLTISLATGRSNSPLRSALDGFQKKSENSTPTS